MTFGSGFSLVYLCKCMRSSWPFDSVVYSCQRCKHCGTTFAVMPELCDEPTPHNFVTIHDTTFCTQCHERQEEA